MPVEEATLAPSGEGDKSEGRAVRAIGSHFKHPWHPFIIRHVAIWFPWEVKKKKKKADTLTHSEQDYKCQLFQHNEPSVQREGWKKNHFTVHAVVSYSDAKPQLREHLMASKRENTWKHARTCICITCRAKWIHRWWWCVCCSALVLVKRTRGVDGYPVDASVLCLELLQEDSHAVAERLEGELTALSPGRQTDWDHRQPVLIHHCHLCEKGGGGPQADIHHTSWKM